MAMSRAAATRLWGVTEGDARAAADAQAERATTWSMASCVVLVVLVLVLKLPLLRVGLWLLIGGFVVTIGANFVAARAGRSPRALRALGVLALVGYVAGAIVLCLAAGLWLWRLLTT
jgi:hypothetical protein